MDFLGYKRENGKFGVRNYVLVMSSVACANGVVDAIGRALPDVVPITHGYGCGYGPADMGVSHRALAGIINNPNVGAVLVVGLGCEVLKADYLTQVAEGKPAEALVIQESGGSAAATAKGIEIASRFQKQLRTQKRVPVPVSELTIGLECGGSDALSGVTANPAVGAAADRFVREGGTVILSETTEMIGTAHILKRRCATPELGEQIENLVNNHERHVRASLGDLAGMVIAPGNIEGGLSSITEKSLGCIMKGGTTPITEILEYAGRPSKRGFVIMDTPGYDIDSMAGEAAAGCQIILFTTGRGSTAGFPGVPVIKISSNSRTFKNMPGDMDVNAGAIADGDKTLEEVGHEIFELSITVANGARTCAELNRSVPFNYLKQGPTF
ncbi:UxaA family hydrolase [Candidatus Poribacteria bacterium]|nr:UxaA family hydrolase [Candidatus Poribacteria bacterium]